MSSSSDEDWMPKSRPPGASANTGESAMMAARRRALQQQRDAEQSKQPQNAALATHRPPPAGRLGQASKPQESTLPAAFLGSDDDVVGSHAVAQQPTPSQTAPSQGVASAGTTKPPTHEETVEELRRQIDAKKKLLQSSKEKETMLIEKWRLTKAQRQAEVDRLSSKVRRAWAALEDSKSASETKIREAQDHLEAELLAARKTVEKETRDTYNVKIAAMQKELAELKAEEEQLRSLLSSDDGTKDIVNTALSSAVEALIGRMDEIFTKEEGNGLSIETWKAELESMVEREVRTAFAVGVDSQAQAEREEYKKFFSGMLDFWTSAEEQERDHILKMDEALLSDLQSMAQEDLHRLEQEELSMETIYVQSRESWASEHQKLLQQELDAALQRREREFAEQRRQRHDLHVERLRFMDEKHKECMAVEEALHQREMEQLRQGASREEQLQEEQRRVLQAADEDVQKTAETLQGILVSVEEAAESLKSYQQAIEEGRRQIELERQKSLQDQERTLKELVDFAASQCTDMEEERRSLEDSISQLRIASQTIERHLQDESVWLAQQEATSKRSRQEWEREYHKWKCLVQQERQSCESRFHESLAALQSSLSLLEAEEREVTVESAAVERVFSEMTTATDAEVAALRQREEDLQRRSVAVQQLLADIEQKKSIVSDVKQKMEEEQQQLRQDQEILQEEEAQVRDMAEALRLAKTQLVFQVPGGEAAGVVKAPDPVTVPSQSSGPWAQSTLPAPQPVPQLTSGEKIKEKRHKTTRRVVHKNPNRLPATVLRELREQLETFPSYEASYNALAPLRSAPLEPRERHVSRRHEKLPHHRKETSGASSTAALKVDNHRGQTEHIPSQQHRHQRRHVDPSSVSPSYDTSLQASTVYDDWSPSGNTFTNLVPFSDYEMSLNSTSPF